VGGGRRRRRGLGSALMYQRVRRRMWSMGPHLNMVAAIGAPSVVNRVVISRIATGKTVAK